ncbi:MAG: hypothetical protein KDD69_12980, partial [Bdellovibrionales bacterium]|nr:hypothetical protein [Bdellovibrionales bacterium]
MATNRPRPNESQTTILVKIGLNKNGRPNLAVAGQPKKSLFNVLLWFRRSKQNNKVFYVETGSENAVVTATASPSDRTLTLSVDPHRAALSWAGTTSSAFVALVDADLRVDKFAPLDDAATMGRQRSPDVPSFEGDDSRSRVSAPKTPTVGEANKPEPREVSIDAQERLKKEHGSRASTVQQAHPTQRLVEDGCTSAVRPAVKAR